MERLQNQRQASCRHHRKSAACSIRFVCGIVAAVALVGICSESFAQSHARESFYRITFDDKPVGYEHVRVHAIDGRQPPVLMCYRKTQLNLRRLGQDLTLQASLWTEQTTDGKLLNFALQRTDGQDAALQRSGVFVPEQGLYRIQENQTATRREYELQSDGIFYSPIFSTWLPSHVFAAKRRAVFPVLFPETAGASGIVAEKKQPRRFQKEDRTYVTATRVLFYPEADPTMSTTLLVSDDFSVLRQEKIQLGGVLAISLTTADVALAAVANKSLDLDSQAIIPIDRQIAASTTREQLILDLTVGTGFLDAVPESSFQKVEVIGDKSIRITLTRPEVNGGGIQHGPVLNRNKPTSTRWMPLDDPVLQRFAAIAAGSETDPYTVSRRLEAFAQAKLNRSAFSTEILSADQVARTLRGDCTEHAVFLAALMRLNGIQSRVVSGLAYTNQQYGFSGHMWVEALIDGNWFPFDSTSASGGVGTTHIKLADSEMPDTLVSGVSLFLPVLNLAGRAEIHVISAR